MNADVILMHAVAIKNMEKVAQDVEERLRAAREQLALARFARDSGMSDVAVKSAVAGAASELGTARNRTATLTTLISDLKMVLD